ncbi:cleavage and polyadenylation specificity factor subunit 6-like [Chelonia mydas]|uniref:cleavage and polyadenylation specificity factor subunit 6-like n=1 Tax=Chelonia mydas TaxID=8469 RepID=UPI0018A1CF19|nr:cleavage and polyadenylation specificity factor subunit 6-like [Chelonia mydas]
MFRRNVLSTYPLNASDLEFFWERQKKNTYIMLIDSLVGITPGGILHHCACTEFMSPADFFVSPQKNDFDGDAKGSHKSGHATLLSSTFWLPRAAGCEAGLGKTWLMAPTIMPGSTASPGWAGEDGTSSSPAPHPGLCQTHPQISPLAVGSSTNSHPSNPCASRTPHAQTLPQSLTPLPPRQAPFPLHLPNEPPGSPPYQAPVSCTWLATPLSPTPPASGPPHIHPDPSAEPQPPSSEPPLQSPITVALRTPPTSPCAFRSPPPPHTHTHTHSDPRLRYLVHGGAGLWGISWAGPILALCQGCVQPHH